MEKKNDSYKNDAYAWGGILKEMDKELLENLRWYFEKNYGPLPKQPEESKPKKSQDEEEVERLIKDIESKGDLNER